MKKINMKLVRKVLAHVKGDLRRLSMQVYGVHAGERDQLRTYPACKTKACFAGWAVLLTTPKKRRSKLFDKNGWMNADTVPRHAQRLLGLGMGESFNIFSGRASCTSGAKRQFSQLKKDINDVLKERGMKERV
jgi:hypothetical protein